MPVASTPPASVSTPDAFWTQVLVDMGAPVTQSNMDALRAWSAHEGTRASYNPLAVSQSAGQQLAAYQIPNTGLAKSFATPQAGAKATAIFLENGHYPSIVAAFRTGNALPYLQAGTGPVAAQLHIWSGGYNKIGNDISYVSPAFAGLGKAGTSSTGAGGSNTPLPNNPSATPAATSSGCKTIGESMQGAALGVPGAQQVAGFVGWITQACVYKRLAIQGVSLVLILYGLKMMGHDEPLKIIQSPVTSAKDAIRA